MISIIIPVFNNERYLNDSISSLINQTVFDQMELVIVDDGSTDGSYEIIKGYAARYNNIKAIHQENGGVSAARNAGIKACSGAFIAFFDSDDIAEPKLYERLLRLIEEHNADISIVDFSRVFEDGSCVKYRKRCKQEWNGSVDIMKDFFKNENIGINSVDKLFRRELVVGNEFPEGYAIGEDLFFVYSVLRKASKIVLDSSEALYRYMIREGSAMKTGFNVKYCDTVKLSEKILEMEKDNTEVKPYAEANYIHEICKTLRMLYASKEGKEYEKLREEYLSVIRRYSIINGFKYMNLKHFVALLLMKISPKLYNYIYVLRKLG